ncbi:type II toxin-antitoxin system PemK/MazF family toxin [Algiphilus aromaticivorans]|uniref:type II toxin-antitoxin system PemK/MazF family toxin n=1 Tax=Algiphilus aromaticivorans TaxID=382454 RepID=UPI0005C2086F|nr:type II toxin-antitoxin system PemK/MazF family toxin [Algiphilus aromaticivorans]
MKRGSIVTVTLQGDYGKPRPALVVQSDFFDEHPSVTLLPISSDLRAAPLIRVDLSPTPDNGLRQRSQIMVDKTVTVKRTRIGEEIGHIASEELLEVNRRLAIFLGIAG